MAKNTGKGSREGEVRERSQVKNPKTGDYVKRDTKSGQFLDVKRDTKSGQFLDVKRDGRPLKGVRKEN